MATKPLLDFESLLKPVPGDDPAGASLRYAGDYDKVRDLRPKPDRDAFEAGGQEGQWPKIVEATTSRLRDKSKDLQLCAWLAEALAQLHGMAGMRDGARLSREMLEKYWDGLHPRIEDDDLESRAAPLEWMLGDTGASWVLEARLTKEPAADPNGPNSIPVTYNLWKAIVLDRSQDKLSLGAAVDAAFAKTPSEFFINLWEDGKGALEELVLLNAVLDERFGQVAPGVTSVREAVEKCMSRIKQLLTQRGVSLEPLPVDGESSADTDSNGQPHQSRGGGVLHTRDDALMRLAEVADFFRRTEPHSPVSYLIQRAITWSRMSFEQLLSELVEDENSRRQISNTLGIRGDESGAAEGSSSQQADTGGSN